MILSGRLTIAIQPNTIGYALYDSPVGQLSWIGQKLLNCKSNIPYEVDGF